jgi:CheY-like chemotaxis protein
MKLRILVVDDNKDSATTLAKILNLMGHETRIVHDGGRAVAAAEEYRPEVILLDIGLPVMSGYEVAKTIRSQSWSKGVIIIALSGWGQDEDRVRSEQAGMNMHLVKPIDPDNLENLLGTLGSQPAFSSFSQTESR